MLKFTPTHPHSEYFYQKSLWKPKCRPDMILLASNSGKTVLCTDLSSGRGLLPLSLQRSRPPVPAFAALLPAHCHPAACQAVPGVHNKPTNTTNQHNPQTQLTQPTNTNISKGNMLYHLPPHYNTLKLWPTTTTIFEMVVDIWNAVLVVSWKVGWKCIKPTNTQMGFGW